MKVKELHLLAFYVARPRNPSMTKIKGYMKDPANIQYDEQVEITRGLSTKDQQYAGVILNLNKKTVVSNRFNREQKNFDEMFKYFLDAYPQYVAEVMAGLDLAYLEQFIPKDQPSEADTTVIDTPAVEVNEEVKAD